jgi:hypothetical protein
VTTEEEIATTQPPAAGIELGLAQPDCSTHVSEVFQLQATYPRPDPKCSSALIKDLRYEKLLPEAYRADYHFATGDTCPGLPGVPTNIRFLVGRTMADC